MHNLGPSLKIDRDFDAYIKLLMIKNQLFVAHYNMLVLNSLYMVKHVAETVLSESHTFWLLSSSLGVKNICKMSVSTQGPLW